MDKQMDYEKIERADRVRQRTVKTATYALLAVWAIVVLFPFYWMVLTSLKSYGDYNAENIPQFITLSPTFQNYIDAFTEVPLAKYFLNTVIFTVATTALMLLVIVFATVLTLPPATCSVRYLTPDNVSMLINFLSV